MRTEVFKEDHDILMICLNVPNEIYCEVLTKLFNNKRDNKSIIDLHNYYGDNNITMAIDLDTYEARNKEEAKKHLLEWTKSIGTELKFIDNEWQEFNSTIEQFDCVKARIYTYTSVFEKDCDLLTYDIVEW